YNSRNDPGLLRLLPYEIQEGLEIVMGDLRDPEGVRKAVDGVEIIFHLGAIIPIPYSYVHPREVMETNAGGTLNVLLAARDVGVRRLIHTSTSEVYGTAEYVPIDEKHPLNAQSPYSASKIAADKLVESFHLCYGLPAVTVRPFNTYGPRQSDRAVIPTIVAQALTQDKVLLGAMQPRRDLTYVTDTVSGLIAAACAENVEGQVINLGCGEDISIEALAQCIIQLTGRDTELVFDATRIRPPRSEVQQLLADNTKAGKLLSWEPEVALEEGLRITIEWISNRLSLYSPHEYVT
ncbi:MAG: GDP-mannose 4,6-dehydratase, partial [Armatimonadetes bacterium]|nr:GDP-mannose 4,6-dehydratase [Armatimonadota bacterium]